MLRWFAWTCVWLGVVSLTSAQVSEDFLPQIQGPVAAVLGEAPVQVQAQLVPSAQSGQVVLQVQVRMAPGWYIYSLTQPKGGPVASSIRVQLPEGAKLLGPFGPDRPPQVKQDPIFGNLPVETHSGEVLWQAPLELPSGTKVEQLVISGAVRLQACTKQRCELPKWYRFQARWKPGPAVALAQPKPAPAADGGKSDPVILKHPFATLQGELVPAVAKAGQVIELRVKLVPKRGYHVYAYSTDAVSRPFANPTLLAMVQMPSGTRILSIRPDAPVLKKNLVAQHPPGPVTWTLKLQLPQRLNQASYLLEGSIGYQVCTERTCDRPRGARFYAMLKIGPQAQGKVALRWKNSSYRDAKIRQFGPGPGPGGAAASTGSGAGQSKPTESQPPASSKQDHAQELLWEPFSLETLQQLTGVELEQIQVAQATSTLAWDVLLVYLGLAFLGGLVLNVMPCVLPVLGLKVMSFIQQSGESRTRAFLLNVYYTLGLLVVFWALAVAAIVLGLSWGQQFAFVPFTITVTAVVFAFALALLGVWEIPIPGFLGTGKAGQLAQKEGPAGAFAKGMLTTVLATPCTGPFMGSALMWAVKQHPAVVLATFTTLGLGMASPYLVIGLFPRLVSWLPKPGPWMETFKQFMGFVLLGTVVWLLTTLPPESVVPTVALLFALWFGFWWVGRINPVAPRLAKLRAWLTAAVMTAGLGWVALVYLGEVMQDRFRWQVNLAVVEAIQQAQLSSPGKLALQAQRPPGRYTVFVDFTADW